MLSRRSAVFAALEASQSSESNDGVWRHSYVSFSKVTVALCGLFSASDAGVTESDVIFPLLVVSIQEESTKDFSIYQKLKKSLTSLSLVL